MTPRDPNSKITIRPAPADPGGAPPRRPAPRRSRPPVYQYYLQDHPVLIPVGTLLLGGVCLYLTIFSHLLQDLIVGAGGAG
ncbi:MAG TPA: hypothetical protein VKY74_05825, partial [Chloroflexia bacterium]|nr:hypothetical protein [Chloroflexia bacterium]